MSNTENKPPNDQFPEVIPKEISDAELRKMEYRELMFMINKCKARLQHCIRMDAYDYDQFANVWDRMKRMVAIARERSTTEQHDEFDPFQLELFI